ncbi:MAG: efflux RND transporter periplasmic adaptor subunit [bacterium]
MSQENDITEDISARILRFIWEIAPWLMVCSLTVAILMLGLEISRKKKRLKAENLAAYKNERPPVNVVVQKVQPTEVVDRIMLPALIAPWEDLTLYAEVSGQIISFFAKEGDKVKEGDLLAKIDPRDYQNRLMQVQAAYDLAQLEFERISKLAQVNTATQAQLDSTRAHLKETESALAAAKLDLERCTITSPISGFINKRFAKKGLLVSRADPLFQILDTERVKVEVGIPESDVQAVSSLEEADITIEALNNMKIKGKKIFLSRQPNTFARVYELKLAVDNPAGMLRPGMFATVDIVKKRYPDSLVVPLYAVINNSDEYFLYIINDDFAHYRAVTLGIMQGWEVQILEGLKANERVVVVGQRNLEDGQKVKIIRSIQDPKEL